MRTFIVGVKYGTYSFVSRRRYSARSTAYVVIMVVVVVVVETDPLLLVLLHQTFIVSASLECPPYFFPGRLSHSRQVSVLGDVQFDNPNGIKNTYIIIIVPVAVAVPLVPVLAVTVIIRPPCNYFPHPCTFFVFGDGFCDMVTFCIRGYR